MNAKPFRTAPMKDGVRYDSRGEPIAPDRVTDKEYIAALEASPDPRAKSLLRLALRRMAKLGEEG